MKELNVNISPSQQSELLRSLEKFASGFPSLPDAINRTLEQAEDKMNNYAIGNDPLEGIGKIKKPFNPVSIEYERRVNSADANSVDVSLTAKSSNLERISKGQKGYEFDMKTKYPYGKQSRVSKKGIPYLIVKFRWGTANKDGERRAHFSNVIPTIEYNTRVKAMSKSEVLKTTHFEPNYSGEMIERQEYNWADRLRQAWDKKAKGLVRMKDAIGSTYFTFRVISAKSPASSWIRRVKEVPPVNVSEAWAKTMQPILEKNIEEAIKKDIEP